MGELPQHLQPMTIQGIPYWWRSSHSLACSFFEHAWGSMVYFCFAFDLPLICLDRQIELIGQPDAQFMLYCYSFCYIAKIFGFWHNWSPDFGSKANYRAIAIYASPDWRCSNIDKTTRPQPTPKILFLIPRCPRQGFHISSLNYHFTFIFEGLTKWLFLKGPTKPFFRCTRAQLSSGRSLRHYIGHLGSCKQECGQPHDGTGEITFYGPDWEVPLTSKSASLLTTTPTPTVVTL